MHNGYAIEATNLTKTYGDLLAVDHVDLQVRPGEIFGLLGPNGAGKTTTVRMLNTLLEPTEGQVLLNGYNVSRHPYQAKRQFGLVPEESNVYTELSTWDNLAFTARLYRIRRGEREERVNELLEMFGLQDKRKDKVFTLSKGLRQRLSLAMALIHRPSILFLDEPALGLDVQSAQLIRERVRQLNREGITILLTTHQIEMADQLCDRVAIIHHGQIVTIETPDRLKQASDERQSVEVALAGDRIEQYEEFAYLPGVTETAKEKGKLRLYTADPPALMGEVMRYVQAHSLPLTSLSTPMPKLEDVFLSITGQGLGPARPKHASAQCKNCPMHDECKENGDEEKPERAPRRRSGLLRSACEH